MINLEVGMFIRTEYGIAKIIERGDNYLHCDNTIMRSFGDNFYSWDIERLNIIKASHNIIDLIEVGDYVNGYEVIEKPYRYQNINFVSINSRESWGWGIGEMPFTEIESIVTKEQFKSMEYKVEDSI